MTAQAALDHLRAQGITLTCTGATVRVSPRHLVTPAVSELIQTYKPDLLTLLTAESGASSLAVEPAAQQREESHVIGAVEAHSLAPCPCSHTDTYRRPSGVRVGLDCAATLAPGAPDWQTQEVVYCDPGMHTWFPRCEGDGGMLQCAKCPEVQAAQTAAAEPARHPAVHDPRCEGIGLVVVSGVGWSCPTCDRRYFVPTVPPSSAPAQAALPLAEGLQPGEVVPQRKGRR